MNAPVLSLWRGELTPKPSMMAIAERVCEKHGLTMEELKGPRRARHYVRPRQEAMHEMGAVGLWSLTQIGRFLGNRDHTTVLHGIRRHEDRLAAQ